MTGDCDMLYLIVLLFFYLQTFVPSVFSYRTAGIVLLTLVLFVVRKREKLRIPVMFVILLFSLFSSSLDRTIMYIPIDEKELCGIYGTVVTAPNRKKHRWVGYSVMIESVTNSRGDFFSASGKVYVIGPDLSATKGDRVFVEGRIKDTYFLSSGGAVKEKGRWGRIREKVNVAFISSLPRGDRGNIISLLLTGTTLDGDSSLSDRVRELGLSHMLSLSGMHLGFISSIVMPFLCLLLPKRKAGCVKNLILLAFVYLAGMRTSLVRSLIFVFLIPFFGIENSFILSLVFLLKLFPCYVDEVATVLSFTSLGGILFIAEPQKILEKGKIPIISTLLTGMLTSVSATVASSPIVFSVFGEWQPYSFLFSVVGMPLITLMFMMTVIRFIIPKSDLIIDGILWLINNSGSISRYFPLTASFDAYYPIAGIFAASVTVLFILGRRRR